jgi:DNA polymerase II small subunit
MQEASSITTINPKHKALVDFFLKHKLLLTHELFETLRITDTFDPEASLAICNASTVFLTKENTLNSNKKPKIVLTQNITEESRGSVEVLFDYEDEVKKREMKDFVMYFTHRYRSIRGMLEQRQELQNTMAITRALAKKEKEQISLIGMVVDKNVTANNNIILTIEDPTGRIKIIVNKNKPETFAIAESLLADEVIGVVGTTSNGIIFANNVILPDIPLHKELKKCPDEAYALVISDVHIGSNHFLPHELNRFIDWINGKVGNEQQQHVAKHVKYLFVVGDMVDGVGIYPGQEDELIIKDIKSQYDAFAEYMKKIPRHIEIIICPGNHDATRLAEPQPPIPKEYAQALYDIPNVRMLSNPCIINIHKNNDFPGFTVLMYHGYSFDYYVANVDSIRERGGYDRADLIMKFLLQRRHLAPSHISTLFVPDIKKDCLVIDTIPDFFLTGHIHKAAAATYRNVTVISGSCWQSKTPFQEKVGHHPEPARVPLLNLQTRQVKMLRF